MARRSEKAASEAADEDYGWLEGDLPVAADGGPPDDADADPRIADRRTLALLLGEPPARIDAFVRAGMPTRGERSRGRALRFSVPECVRWLVSRNTDPLEAAKRRAQEAVARKREAEAARLEGESVSVAEAEAIVRDAAARAQARLLAIPPSFPEHRAALEAEIMEAVNELASAKVEP